MKTEYNKFRFNRIVSRVSVLVAFVSILMGPWSALASPQMDEPISCGEFIAMVATHQPDNPLFPMGHSQLSKEELYLRTVQNMSGKGFRVLDGKSFHDPLEANEFVQVSYAFAEGPLGKNLFEQKLFLKKAGVINSADVGLTTAYDGKVYQTHQEENIVKPVRLATPVYMQDHLETDLAAKATFTFDDKSTLTLAEGSAINITKHIYDPEKDLRQTIVHLSKGAVRFVVTKGKARGSMFKVITPTATAGVRGTEFVVIVNPSGKTTFLVLEGQIETKDILERGLGKEGETYLVSAGESQSFFKNDKATKVTKAPPGLLMLATDSTSPPGLTFEPRGLSKKMATHGAQKLTWVKKAKINTDLKAKVLKLAKNIALSDAKTPGNKFGKIKMENPSILTFNKSEKSDTMSKVKTDIKTNAKVNAKQIARETIKGKP